MVYHLSNIATQIVSDTRTEIFDIIHLFDAVTNQMNSEQNEAPIIAMRFHRSTKEPLPDFAQFASGGGWGWGVAAVGFSLC